jgi:hypothetical protein
MYIVFHSCKKRVGIPIKSFQESSLFQPDITCMKLGNISINNCLVCMCVCVCMYGRGDHQKSFMYLLLVKTKCMLVFMF